MTTDPDGVVVDVTRGRIRDVPVLRAYENEVTHLAKEAGTGPIFLPERAGINRRQVPNFIARCPKGRARAPTWSV